MAARRKRRRARRVLHLGAAPPRVWHAEIDLVCAEIGKKTVRISGPTSKAALEKAMNPRSSLPFYAQTGRCRIVGRRVVSGA